jgi:2-polyprenyl-6-methoxyphenol hydroxylase-like FAD-dependent oxidoreductase
MFWRKKPQVLVAGAGPVGLFTALRLAHKGVEVQIVDRAWRTGAHSYALAIHAATIPLLEEVGLREGVLNEGLRVRSVGLFDERQRKATLSLNTLMQDFAFACVMRQETLEDLLERALNQAGVRVDWDHDVSAIEEMDDHVSVRIDRLEGDSRGYGVAHIERIIGNTQLLNVPFVVGADGHNSSVRRMLGIEFEYQNDASEFAVFEFKTDFEIGAEVRIVLTGDMTSVLWPLPGGYCRWSFELERRERRPRGRTKDRFFGDPGVRHNSLLEVSHLEALLAERAPWFTGSIEEMEWREIVGFQRGMASRFGRDRVWLAGDSGHVTGPAGMQSMNVGLREGARLAEAIAGALQGEHAEEVFSRYDDDRLTEWKRLLMVDGISRPHPTADDWIVRNGARIIESLPASGPDLEELAGRLGLRIPWIEHAPQPA